MVKWDTVPEIPNYQTSFTPFQGTNLEFSGIWDKVDGVERYCLNIFAHFHQRKSSIVSLLPHLTITNIK